MLEGVLPLLSGLAHITGGGLPGKLPPVLPDNMAASIDTASWTPPPIFRVLQEEGGISQSEMFSVFNMGIGMVAVCPEDRAETFCERIPEAIPVGRVVPRDSDEQVLLKM